MIYCEERVELKFWGKSLPLPTNLNEVHYTQDLPNMWFGNVNSHKNYSILTRILEIIGIVIIMTNIIIIVLFQVNKNHNSLQHKVTSI